MDDHHDPIAFIHSLIGRKVEAPDNAPTYEPTEDGEPELRKKSCRKQTVTDWDMFHESAVGFNIERLPGPRTHRAKSKPFDSKEGLVLAAMGNAGRWRARIGHLHYVESLTAREIAQRENLP